MKTKRYNSTEERMILTAMIVDITVLGRIAIKYQKKMFKSSYANLVAKWCVSFYRKYEDVPMNQIESLYESWADETNDKDNIKLVGKFLHTLSEDYEALAEESNSDYVLDMAGAYFNRVKLERLREHIEGDIDRGKTTAALNRVLSFDQIEMGVGEGINILQDDEAIKEAFKEKGKSIIQYPGALGKFFEGSLVREGFITFIAPDKVGKSFWLQDMGFRGMLQRKRVAYFDAGDNSQNQIMRRLMTRVSRRPLSAKTIEYPIDIEKDGKYAVMVEHEDRYWTKRLSWRVAKKACKQLMKNKIKSRDPYFKLSCHPNSTLTVSMIQEILNNWALNGWVPDVIVIDYADILLMNGVGLEGRDLIDNAWKQLRALSQRMHCLVVTATQGDAGAYDAKIITKKNFSGDKRKNAHVTGTIGLNQNADEKDIGVMRLNWVILRDNPFNEKKCVYVAGCLSIANPAIKSIF